MRTRRPIIRCPEQDATPASSPFMAEEQALPETLNLQNSETRLRALTNRLLALGGAAVIGVTLLMPSNTSAGESLDHLPMVGNVRWLTALGLQELTGTANEEGSTPQRSPSVQKLRDEYRKIELHEPYSTAP